MPKHLQRTRGDKLPAASQYTCGQIAFMMQVSHRTAAKMIDRNIIKGYRMLSGKTEAVRERRVLHDSLVAFIDEFPDYSFMLDRLDNYDPAVDFGKDYKQRWERKRAKMPRRRVQEELDSRGLESGLEHESSGEETRPESN